MPEIPPGIKGSILLNKDLSVMNFLQFPLPGIARESTSSTVGQAKSFFSTSYPTVTDPKVIQNIVLPPLPILEQISQDIDLTSTQSIICQHSPGFAGDRFPLWILTYWTEVAQIWPLKKIWVLAEEALETRKKNKTCTDETRMLINKVYNSLACIPWGQNINGFPGTVPTECLTRYLTDDWLIDENENQMLYLLERELARSGHGGIHIADTFLITRLHEIYRLPDRDEHYATAKRNAWIRRRGQDLGTGALEKLVAIVNLDQNHWVPVVIDALPCDVGIQRPLKLSIKKRTTKMLLKICCQRRTKVHPHQNSKRG